MKSSHVVSLYRTVIGKGWERRRADAAHGRNCGKRRDAWPTGKEAARFVRARAHGPLRDRGGALVSLATSAGAWRASLSLARFSLRASRIQSTDAIGRARRRQCPNEVCNCVQREY